MVDEDAATSAQLAGLLRIDIDWQLVENKLKTYREDSQTFLSMALSKCVFSPETHVRSESSDKPNVV